MHDILIVDGYNVLRSSTLYAHSGEGAPDTSKTANFTEDTESPASSRGAASGSADFLDYTDDHHNVLREALINDVAVFAHKRFEATVVFDGKGNPNSTGERSDVAGVGVIFSAAGTSADSVIEELAHTAAATGRNVLVITSDATLQWTVLGKNVTRMSAAGFADEMRAIKKTTIHEVEAVAHKNTLAERIDKETRDRLSRMARGLG